MNDSHDTIVWLPFRRESKFLASTHPVTALCVCVYMLHYLRVGLRITIMQSHTHTMQQMHMHKTVTGRVEAKSYSLVEGNRSIDGLITQKNESDEMHCGKIWIHANVTSKTWDTYIPSHCSYGTTTLIL